MSESQLSRTVDVFPNPSTQPMRQGDGMMLPRELGTLDSNHDVHESEHTGYFAPGPSVLSHAVGMQNPDAALNDANVSTFSPDLMMGDVFTESSLAEFLNDVMLPFVPSGGHMAEEACPQPRLRRDYLDFGSSWVDMAEFEAMLEGTDVEALTRPSGPGYNLALPPSGTRTPLFGESFGARNAAFSKSVWLWVPTKKDRAGADPFDLSLPHTNLDSPETRALAETLLPDQHIDQSLRDRLLALILSTCAPDAHQTVVTSFPSADLLDRLMHFSLGIQFGRIDSWIHVPSLNIEENLELLLTIIAAGAVSSSVVPIRRLGFALQESARTASSTRFESNNAFTRDLGCIQGLVLGLYVGLWSGDKRKMELSESFALTAITMLRRAGRFSRPKKNLLLPTLDDSPETLEQKWREWAQIESYKRLAAHVLICDSQTSMAQQIPPLLSPTEMTLDLPSSRDLWTASNARQWRDVYLRHGSLGPEKAVSIAQSISQVGEIRRNGSIDISLSALIIVHSVWVAVWNHLQLTTLVHGPQSNQTGSGSFLSSNPWDHSVSHLLDQIRLIFSDWGGDFRAEMALVLERVVLSMHVSFEQVQLFAGKEGEEEARRAFPGLRQWAGTKDARKAVWYAGQVLRAASRCPPKKLRDFYAVCVYHAGMTFWTYAVLWDSTSYQRGPQEDSQRARATHSASEIEDLVWLDGCDCPAVQRFLSLNRGNPVISSLGSRDQSEPADAISLSNANAIMNVCIELLQRSSSITGDGTSTPLVENLSQLMRDLGKAAHDLVQGNTRRARGQQTGSRG